ncbi:ABC transporter substrate-binding protein [Skermanella stibiiresistens SB22]|uniref:ABC transporter substrate-binding protein n=1 Tax=Skermanella stibiiresistens SB22 TaxID=1385369 RepID=W9H6H2_9PROT|nr:ABC transporter substrate-binding protein [Skermanella stibiiresistens]EWY39373.1 ABC transporter substrate-binding protein [Skermanella stibiiresistens SB22]
MRHLVTSLFVAVSLLFGAQAQAAGPPGDTSTTRPAVRVGVLKFGTVSWELDTIKSHGLDAGEGIDLRIVDLASNQATQVALQGGAVDMIVTDWLWVSRQRAAGADFTLAPYSTAAGSIMVPANSPINSIADLKGRRIGVAGGPLDKSWLLLRALSIQKNGFDPDKDSEKVFAAPPLLNEQVANGGVDAALNYWNFAARLKAAGLRQVVTVDEIEKELGIETSVPIIGYVFHDAWADANGLALNAFLRASQKAKAIMRDSDDEWRRLAPLTKAEDDATLLALRDGYRAGIPTSWGDAERRDAERVYEILAKLGGRELVGDSPQLSPGTFWAGIRF